MKINPPEAYCKVCGELCNIYPSDGTQGICPEHCLDHEYIYDKHEGYYCTHCGQEPPNDWFYDRMLNEDSNPICKG